MSRRTEKVSKQVQQELAKIIQDNLAEKSSLITVTSAQVAPDLRHADIWISTPDNDPEIIDRIKEKQSQIQHQLSTRLRAMKYVPKLKFKLDTTGALVDRIDNLLAKGKK